MKRYFTHYWSNDTCDGSYGQGLSGITLSHTAGNGFKKRGVSDGDVVYVVNNYKGRLFLVGRLVVAGGVVDQNAAMERIGGDIWEAEEHVIAQDGSGTPMYFLRGVDPAIVSQLRFLNTSGEEVMLKYESPGVLDRQTLRSVRELTSTSAELLEMVLKQPHEDPELESEADTDDADEDEETEGTDGDEHDDEAFDSTMDDNEADEILLQYGDHARNKIIEQAAVDFVTASLIRDGWSVHSRELDRCGYDLHCTRDDEEMHVEVKGTSGDAIRFMMTDHEFSTAVEDLDYYVYVVTKATSEEPRLSSFDGEDLINCFQSKPTQWAFAHTGDDDLKERDS